MQNCKRLCRKKSKRTSLTKAEQPQTARCCNINVLTQNLMGTATKIQETELNATELEHDVMVFTETNFKEDSKRG